MFVSDKFPTYKLDETLVDRKYLAWYFRCPILWEEAQGLSTGSAAISKLTLNPPKFNKLTIPFPPLTEQKRIVLKIERLFIQADAALRLSAKSRMIGSAFMDSCLGHVMDEFTYLGRLEDFVTFKPRSGPSFITAPDANGIPVLMPSSVTGFGVNLKKVEYSVGPVEVGEKDMLLPGDIIIARGNKRDQVGNAGVVPKECKGWVCANLLMRMQVDAQRVDTNFLIYWLRSPRMRKHVYDQMSGTNPNIQKINQKKILNFPFPLGVEVSEQRRIVTYLDNLQEEIDRLKALQTQTAAELDALLPSILDKAFKGEL